MTGVSSPAEAEEFSSSLCVQTSSQVHPASYPTGTGVLSLGVKRGRGVTLTTHPPQIVPRLITSRSYTSSPTSTSMVCSETALQTWTIIGESNEYVIRAFGKHFKVIRVSIYSTVRQARHRIDF
jgi:hypothetical protein